MNTVTLTPDHLVVEPEGLDKLWSFTRRLEIPLEHVRGATFDPGASDEPKGIRAPGLHTPGLRSSGKWSGTFIRDGEKSFWNVTAGGPSADGTIEIELAGEHFDRLFLTVAAPRQLVDQINGAVHAAD